MKKIILYYLKRHTGEQTVNSIRRQFVILFKKYKHYHYHNDFLRFGKFIIMLLLLFLAFFYSLKYFSDKTALETKFGISDSYIEENSNIK